MEAPLEQIAERQKESWNKFSSGWQKWDPLVMDFVQPVKDEIIRVLHPKAGEHVLDVASGTGEPGLTIAELIDGGKVTAIDLSEKMLAVAKEKAIKRGVKNYEAVVGDVSNLPFEDSVFDAVSCRYGFMFFPDMLMAAKEMVRVLKPGGKVVTAVWDVPEKNFWVTAIMGTIARKMHLAPPPEGAPGMFRCSKPGFMKNLFERAGLKNISTTEVSSPLHCGTAEIYWDFQTEVGAPIVAALSNADEKMKEEIRNEVIQLIKQKYPSDNIAIDASSIVVCGEK